MLQKNSTKISLYVAKLLISFILIQPQQSFSQIAKKNSPPPASTQEISPVEERVKKENKISPNSFSIAFYKPTYILPYYYTGSPDYKAYNTPGNEKLSKSEIKYQLSFKVPIWKNIFHSRSSLNLAYTQLSYWQAYNNTAFFRETDYEPELFLANEINLQVYKAWHINFLNLGAVHQSNGFGGSMERSWNRIYLDIITSTENWMIGVRPWIIIHDKTMREHNPNIADYLGYGQVLVAFKYYSQVFSVQTRSFFEHGGQRVTTEVAWSFPITSYLNGYLQVFSGYGQSLIEYNHRTNSAGVGIALNNWI